MRSEIHPLTDVILFAYKLEAQRQEEVLKQAVCPYEIVLDKSHIASFLDSGYAVGGSLSENWLIYIPVAMAAMKAMIETGFLEKENGTPFTDGDTGCVVCPSIDLGPAVPKEEPLRERIGLSNDWLEASIELQQLLYHESGLGDRYSKNAQLAALNYELIAQMWKQKNVPEDPRHDFLVTRLYDDLCTFLDAQAYRIELFEMFSMESSKTGEGGAA